MMMLRFTLCALALAVSAGATPAAALAPPAAESGSDDARHRNITSSDSYVPLHPLTATVQANRRARGILQIEAGLEVEDYQLRRRVERYMPRLRNAYVTAMSVYTGAYFEYGEVPDAERIASLLQEATDMTLGQDGAQVLLGMIIIHSD